MFIILIQLFYDVTSNILCGSYTGNVELITGFMLCSTVLWKEILIACWIRTGSVVFRL